MQRILLVLAMGAFATLATATAARAAIVTNTSIPFTDFTAFVPCANGGAGEVIVGVGGELHILAVVTAVTRRTRDDAAVRLASTPQTTPPPRSSASPTTTRSCPRQ